MIRNSHALTGAITLVMVYCALVVTLESWGDKLKIAREEIATLRATASNTTPVTIVSENISSEAYFDRATNTIHLNKPVAKPRKVPKLGGLPQKEPPDYGDPAWSDAVQHPLRVIGDAPKFNDDAGFEATAALTLVLENSRTWLCTPTACVEIPAKVIR